MTTHIFFLIFVKFYKIRKKYWYTRNSSSRRVGCFVCKMFHNFTRAGNCKFCLLSDLAFSLLWVRLHLSKICNTSVMNVKVTLSTYVEI